MHDVDPTAVNPPPPSEPQPVPADSFTAAPPSRAPASDPGPALPQPAARGATPPGEGPRLTYFVMSLAILIGMGLLAFYAGPWLFLRWRVAQAQADADAIYLRRTAELRAEAEAAD